MANGVRAWLEARARSIATLRCLGASPRLVFAVCLIQVMALAAVGVLVGLAAGAALPLLAADLLGDAAAGAAAYPGFSWHRWRWPAPTGC